MTIFNEKFGYGPQEPKERDKTEYMIPECARINTARFVGRKEGWEEALAWILTYINDSGRYPQMLSEIVEMIEEELRQ